MTAYVLIISIAIVAFLILVGIIDFTDYCCLEECIEALQRENTQNILQSLTEEQRQIYYTIFQEMARKGQEPKDYDSKLAIQIMHHFCGNESAESKAKEHTS